MTCHPIKIDDPLAHDKEEQEEKASSHIYFPFGCRVIMQESNVFDGCWLP
jgi:hypothetical protein